MKYVYTFRDFEGPQDTPPPNPYPTTFPPPPPQFPSFKEICSSYCCYVFRTFEPSLATKGIKYVLPICASSDQLYISALARCSSVVRAFAHGAMVVNSIHHGGPIEPYLVPASAPRQEHVLSCLWFDAYPLNSAANRKENSMFHVVAAGFLSHYLSGSLPYV